jgi:hypothetical protein
MLDISIAYNRFKFLGFEFLTWLWFSMDQSKDPLHDQSDVHLSGPMRELDCLSVGNRIVVENRRNNNFETITIKGHDAGIETGLEEGLLALQKGALVTEINLIYQEDQDKWQFTLKGETLSIHNIKHPDIGSIETFEDMDAYVFEKTHHLLKIMDLTDKLFQTFIHVRLSNQWKNETVFRIKKWIRN